MASSSTLFCVTVMAVLFFAQAKVSVSDLSGVWEGESLGALTNLITDEGPTGICVEDLPDGCREQTPTLQETYTFNGSTLSVATRDRVGVTTREQSAAITPACAALGIYPIEATSDVPPSRIVCYDTKAERLYYIDSRRPLEINCLPFKYGIGPNGPYIEIHHIMTFNGTIADVFARGPLFSCGPVPEDCVGDFYAEAMVRFAFDHKFTVYCVEGDCLNTATASPPSASEQKESASDV